MCSLYAGRFRGRINTFPFGLLFFVSLILLFPFESFFESNLEDKVAFKGWELTGSGYACTVSLGMFMGYVSL